MHLIAEKLSQLGTAEQKLAEYVRANPHSVAFVSARTLASQAGVSPATVVRFFPRLGYASYAMAQQQLQIALAGQYETPHQRLELNPTTGSSPQSASLQALEQDLHNLAAMGSVLQSPAYAQLLTWLSTCSGRIAVAGGRYSRGPAQLLAHQLSIAMPTSWVDPLQGGMDSLQDFGSDDLVLCISVRRYLRHTQALARWLQTQHVRVVTLTDHAMAPLALQSDLCLVLPTQGTSVFDSYAAFTALGNALTSELCLSRHAEVTRRASAREQLDQHMGFYPDRPTA